MRRDLLMNSILLSSGLLVLYLVSSQFATHEAVNSFAIRGEPITLILVWLAFLLSIYLNRKAILALLKLSKVELLILLGILCLAFSLRQIAPHTHRLFFDEDIYLDMAKQISSNLSSCLCNFGNGSTCFRCEPMKWPAGHPMLFAPLFLGKDGIEERSAFFFASLLSSVIPLISFVGVYLFTKSKRTAFLTSLVLALHPLLVLWGVTIAAEPTFLLFSALALATLAIYVNEQNDRSLLLFLTSLSLLAYSKVEALAVVLVFLVFCLLRPIHLSRRTLIVYAFFFATLFPLFVHVNYGLRYEPWGASGEKISLSYLIPNLSENIKFFLGYENFNRGIWKGKQLYHPWPLTILAVIGSVVLWRKQKYFFAITASIFLVELLLYSSFYAGSVTYGVDVRYMIPTLLPLAVLAASGIEGVGNFFRSSHISNFLALALLALCFLHFLPLIATPASEIEEASDARLYHDFATEFASRFNESCYFISHVSSIYTVLGKPAMQIWYVYRPELEEVLGKSCVIFDEGEWCAIKVRESGSCLEFPKRYKLELLARLENTKHNKVYSFYRIVT